MHTEGNDPGRPEGTAPHVTGKRDENNPGYETQDVNVGGIITFIAGLVGFLVIFFIFCFIMGKAINTGLLKEDGPADKWHGGAPVDRKRENLASNAALEQRELQSMTAKFPTPRLETDDGNQDTADLHAREDLLLDHYSASPEMGTAVRIPIDRAMELIVQRGLPKPQGAAEVQPVMAGDATPTVTAPLTSGFARTGYELDTIQSREQKLEFTRAQGAH